MIKNIAYVLSLPIRIVAFVLLLPVMLIAIAILPAEEVSDLLKNKIREAWLAPISEWKVGD